MRTRLARNVRSLNVASVWSFRFFGALLFRMPTCLGPKEVAARLGVSERRAQSLFREGAIPAFRVGEKLWRTTGENVEAYIAEQCKRYRRPVKEQN